MGGLTFALRFAKPSSTDQPRLSFKKAPVTHSRVEVSMQNAHDPQSGDVVRVDRGLYGHYGLYLGDGWVMQFGGRIADKPRASIHPATQEDFAKGSGVSVVTHEQRLDPAEAIWRAWWLRDNPPPMGYNLFGYNCEHFARWCATGRFESGQVDGALAFNSLGGVGVALFVQHPRAWIVGLIQLLLTLLLAWISRAQLRRFQRHIEESFPG